MTFLNLIHEPHECARGVAKIACHHLSFVQAISCFEGGLSLVFGPNPNFGILASQIYLREYLCTIFFVDEIFQARHRESTFNDFFVDRPTINTKSPFVLFWNNHTWHNA